MASSTAAAPVSTPRRLGLRMRRQPLDTAVVANAVVPAAWPAAEGKSNGSSAARAASLRWPLSSQSGPYAAPHDLFELGDERLRVLGPLPRLLRHPAPDERAHRLRRVLVGNRRVDVLQRELGEVPARERLAAGQALVEGRGRRIDVGGR